MLKVSGRLIFCTAIVLLWIIGLTVPASADILLRNDSRGDCCSGSQHDLNSSHSVAQGFGLYEPELITAIDLPAIGGGEFDLWITDSLGAGTTLENVVFKASVSFPSVLMTVTVPVGVIVPAGDFYLILSSQSGGAVITGGTMNLYPAAGYTTFQAMESFGDSSTFAPGIPYQYVGWPNYGLNFTMYGSAAQIPEPNTGIFVASLAFALVLGNRLRRATGQLDFSKQLNCIARSSRCAASRRITF